MLVRGMLLLLPVLMATSRPVHSQVVEFHGSATNLGTHTRPTPPLRGALTLRIDSTSGGHMTIGPPLGGSGRIVVRRWSDTLLIFSLGQAGDTIVWLGELDGDRLAGVYRVARGPARGQVGRWAVARTPVARLPELLPLTRSATQERVRDLLLPAREHGSLIAAEHWYGGSPPAARPVRRRGSDAEDSVPLVLVLMLGVGLLRRNRRRFREAPPGTSHRDSQARTPQAPTDGLSAARAVLGVHVGSSQAEIRRAWRAQMLRHHPDLAGTDEARRRVMHRKAQELNLAYAALRKRHEQ